MDVIFVYYFNLYLLLCIILNLKKKKSVFMAAESIYVFQQ